jgi:hypothetical protein
MSTIKVADLQHISNSNNSISIAQNSSVALKHSGNQKLITTANGVDITGSCTATSFTGDGANLTNLPVDLTQLNANNLSSGTIPNDRFPTTLPAIDGSALTGISAGALELVTSGTISSNTISVSFDSTVLTTDSRYLLHFFGITASMSDLYIDATASNAAGTTTYGYGSQYWYDVITHGYGGTNGNQSSSVWRLYTHGYGSGEGTYLNMEFNTSLYPFISGKVMYVDNPSGNSHFHGRISNTVSDTKITGIRLRDQYGYSFRSGSHYKLYKYV